MNAKEAAQLSVQNYNNTRESRDLDRAHQEIKKAAERGLRTATLLSLGHEAKAKLRAQGYTLHEHDGRIDPRDAICTTVTW